MTNDDDNQLLVASSALDRAIDAASAALDAGPSRHNVEHVALRELRVRALKLARAARRPACVGFFGPSQAGKSFLVGALLAHTQGSLRVTCGEQTLDFLREINPAKGVESTGVITRFSTRPAMTARPAFQCDLLGLDAVLESFATGFLVECTSPVLDAERVDKCIREACETRGPVAPAVYRAAWESVWHSLPKRYQDRHPYLNDLRRLEASIGKGWQERVTTTVGWKLVFSLLWGGPGHAADLERLLALLLDGLDRLKQVGTVEVGVEHVRASSTGASVIDAASLNTLGQGRATMPVSLVGANERSAREVNIDPGVLSALIAEIRLPLEPVPGSLLEHADVLDFPGGRALKGLNGFGPSELGTGRLDNAIEVYKRGKLTFLFERYALDREVTALVLCSPGPTKPEAMQLQAQVESWLHIRYGAAAPSSPAEIESPSLFLALTKFDMSLGALRSDNARDRWDSRVQEACVEFWGRGPSSWIRNWGTKGRAFNNMFWIRNPYADQMMSLKPDDGDYETIKHGYLQSRAVLRHVADAAEKWSAVEGTDSAGAPKSGVALLARALTDKLRQDLKGRELVEEAHRIRDDLALLLSGLTPSRDEEEQRARILASARGLAESVRRAMHRRCTGAAFGELMKALAPRPGELEAEVRNAYAIVRSMSVRTSERVRRILCHVLRAWATSAVDRVERTDLGIPRALVEGFVREVCASRRLLPMLGGLVLPYFSRASVDCTLIARVIEVNLSDATLQLFATRERRTPRLPVRLSFSESDAGGGADVIDWGRVELEPEAEDAVRPAALPDLAAVDIVFAGSRAFEDWSARLGELYLENRGARADVAEDDPRTVALRAVLEDLERVYAGAA